ncbi:MAG: hypothetical protein MJY45_03700 [Bacteroidales bacterium]|nr:hypothetical protein [Bacteroidales bacterium]
MKRVKIFLATVALVATVVCANAQEKRESPVKEHLQNHFKFYGFIRNYFAFDTRESFAGSGDLYYWLPKDQLLNADGEDMNAQNQFRFLSLTTRAGVDVSGYRINNLDFGAKIETDFYAGLTGSTGTAQLRLRQAYLTMKWTSPDNPGCSIQLKAGQAWHPMAADLPDIFSLESGAPFGPFSRTPQVTADFNLGSHVTLTASALWQMQYCSMGPSAFDNAGVPTAVASSADYIKYGCTPEFYFGVNCKTGGFLGRIGMDVLSIAPRHTANVGGKTVKVKDRYSAVSPFLYLQYSKDLLKLKLKTTYGNGGEHFNLMSGYAVSSTDDARKWEYTPIRNSATWFTASYGKKFVGAVLLGYSRNFGTSKEIVGPAYVFFQKNGTANFNQMYRIQPEFTYNLGKFTVGLEYMLTSVQYGDAGTMDKYALAKGNLHWITNHRVQAMLKFAF